MLDGAATYTPPMLASMKRRHFLIQHNCTDHFGKRSFTQQGTWQQSNTRPSSKVFVQSIGCIAHEDCQLIKMFRSILRCFDVPLINRMQIILHLTRQISKVFLHQVVSNNHVMSLESKCGCEISARLKPIKVPVEVVAMEVPNKNDINECFLVCHHRKQI